MFRPSLCFLWICLLYRFHCVMLAWLAGDVYCSLRHCNLPRRSLGPSTFSPSLAPMQRNNLGRADVLGFCPFGRTVIGASCVATFSPKQVNKTFTGFGLASFDYLVLGGRGSYWFSRPVVNLDRSKHPQALCGEGGERR